MNKELEEAINRLKILLKDSCDCEECMKDKKAYTIALNYIENSVSKDKIREILKTSKEKEESAVYRYDELYSNLYYAIEKMVEVE